ncbi:MAG TPA: hypothetical protein VFV28_06805 [Limnobacter sp.]|nr:hypothetical protein [Limnobacter sp.]
MKRQQFWYALQAGLVGFWIAVPIIHISGFNWPFLLPFAGLILLAHVLEIPLAAQKLRALNLPFGLVALKTLVFGFTWWLPLSKGHTKT